jgi:hypothetical protein
MRPEGRHADRRVSCDVLLRYPYPDITRAPALACQLFILINPKKRNPDETRNVTVEAASETFLDRIPPFSAPDLLSQRTSELGGDWYAWRE